MINFSPAQCLALSLVAGLPAALAQQPLPTDPAASVPAQRYQSPLSGVRPMVPATVQPWRQSNDIVRQRGGWKAYAKAAQAHEGAASSADSAPVAAPLPAPAASPSVPPAAAGHHQHHQHHQGARP
jgi:hypothetical protein